MYITSLIAPVKNDCLQNLGNIVQTAIPNTPNTLMVHYTTNRQGKNKSKGNQH